MESNTFKFRKESGRFEGRGLKTEKPEHGEGEGGNHLKGLAAVILVGIAVYAVLLLLQDRLIEQQKEPVKSVYTVKKEVGANTHITEQNIDSCFVLEERPVSSLPEGYLGSGERSYLLNSYVSRAYSGKEVVLKNSLVKEALVEKELENPIEVSLGVTNLAQMVGGTIREGDRINIYTVRESVPEKKEGEENGLSENGNKSSECIEIYRNAFVTGAYTAAGDEIKADADLETDAPTTIVNVLIPMEQETAFNTALESGTLRVSRICS